ncbi:hypothetical protein L1887_07080 [Cichorium endivia]|nr:hypothetical protein L1887_07080 [Cichorium endivia]
MGYLLKEALKTLCGVNQWSYAIFWKIGCQNPKLLIWEECYYEPVIYSNLGHEENKVHLLVTKMMKDNYINLLGEGLVGRVAFTQNHQWIISDNKMLGVHPPEVSNEVYTQFSAGIRTIAVIPVHPHGVVQLGSLSTIMENVGFVNDVKGLICQLGCVPGALLSENYIKSEVVSGLTSQQIEMTLQPILYKSDQEIGLDSFLANYQSDAFLGGHVNDTIMSNNPNAHFTEEEHLRPPSRDDLFDIVGMDFKTKPFNGNQTNFINNNSAVLELPSAYEGESRSDIYSSSIISNDHLLDDNVCWTNANLMQRESVKKPGVTSSFSDTRSIISSQIGSWVDLRKSSGIVSEYNGKRLDEIGKSNRKRLKPGENLRPRPKDRQMIQDRVKELREIVPNGAKCSIDALLERTIKHMLFLQSVTKNADILKRTGESNIVSKEGGLLLRDNSEGGATWAYEVGSQSMVCPIIVEDLNSPRHMFVEMLCEERGSFLEIADVIRRLGLTILKGVMESRNDKIWANFTVEANRDVTRMEIFISLVSLFDQSAKNGPAAADCGGNANIPVNEQSFRQVTTVLMAVRPHNNIQTT